MSSVFRFSLPVGVALLALLSPNVVSAAVLYNNFGTNNAFNNSLGKNVSGSGSGVGQFVRVAMRFTPSLTSVVTSADVAAVRAGALTSFTLSLVTDGGGFPSETVLDSSTFSPSSVALLINVPFASAAVVSSGTPYWIVMSPTNPSGTGLGAWQNNTTGAVGNARSVNGGSWIVAPTDTSLALRVSGNAVVVPESGTLALILPVIGAFLVRRRRK